MIGREGVIKLSIEALSLHQLEMGMFALAKFLVWS